MALRNGALALLAILVAACGSSAGSPQASAAPATPSPASPTAAATPLATPTAAPTPVSVLPGEPWIAYQAQGPEGYVVHLVRPDGSAAHVPLGDVPAGVQEHPDWSPDGARMLFTLTEAEVAGGETEDIWLAEVDGWPAKKLLDCEAPCWWVDEPAWSPDGGSIVFQRYVEQKGTPTSTLEILDVATRDTRVVLTASKGLVLFAPRWSPDGRSVVVEVARTRDGRIDSDLVGDSLGIVDVTAATPSIRTIVPFDRLANSPDWSPTADLIVFSAPAKGGELGGKKSDLWVVGPDGSGLARVTDLAAAGGTAIQPTFTPDGERILFVMEDFENAVFGVLGAVQPDGSEIGPAATGPAVTGIHPRLRPTP